MRGGGLNMEIRRLVMDFLFLPGEDVCFLFFFADALPREVGSAESRQF